MFQHAKLCIPKRGEGYTTDDNARALIAVVRYHRLKRDPAVERLASIYLAFLNHMQKPDGNFHNYLSYERTYLDVDGSEDSAGRALWACGCALNSALPRDMRLVAKDIFDRGLPWVWKSTSLRFYSAAIAGLYQYRQAVPNGDSAAHAEKLGDTLVQHFRDENKGEWRWFEPHLTYDNARLVEALFLAYLMVKKPVFLNVAEEAMTFLLETQLVDGVFVPIGNDGWFKRGGSRPFYDQQPLEAAAMVEAAVDGYLATKNERYLDVANVVFGWFLGRNSRNIMMYNPETGGCYDGLSADSVNTNQGGESSISYLLARLRLEGVRRGF
ncbi:MAG: hypothetical protein NWE96_02025 [Candidatus Bathyarchaeota archaeon]|nr:hypothetical protein [Candidatus Bathyarchaeota archaeon]